MIAKYVVIHDTLDYPTQRELIKLRTSWAHGKKVGHAHFVRDNNTFYIVQMDHKNKRK